MKDMPTQLTALHQLGTYWKAWDSQENAKL